MASNNILLPPGKMVDVGGVQLHAIVQGEGSPAVVLEPGLGGFALQFLRIQPGVAAFTRVVAYDRAGQAWSEAARSPRTPENMAAELRALLGKLEIPPPYVLVGHSFGGLLVRCYAGLYPDEVAGLVVVDSSDTNQYEPVPDMDKMVEQTKKGVAMLKALRRLGLAKPLTRLSMGAALKSLDKKDQDLILTIASQPGHQDGTLAELIQYRSFFGTTSQVPPTPGKTPLAVVTAEKSVSGRGKFGRITISEVNARHQQAQKALAESALHGEHVVVQGATHLSIMTDARHAAQVVEVIRRMVENCTAHPE